MPLGPKCGMFMKMPSFKDDEPKKNRKMLKADSLKGTGRCNCRLSGSPGSMSAHLDCRE